MTAKSSTGPGSQAGSTGLNQINSGEVQISMSRKGNLLLTPYNKYKVRKTHSS
jgi:hypothetical protein